MVYDYLERRNELSPWTSFPGVRAKRVSSLRFCALVGTPEGREPSFQATCWVGLGSRGHGTHFSVLGLHHL